MADDRVVILYRRGECGLCEVAQALLEAYAVELNFRMETVDIDADPELAGRYGERIPVAVCLGREVAAGQFRRAAVEDALRDLLPPD